MNQVDLIGFLDTVGYSTTQNPVSEPNQLVIRFSKITENQKIIDGTSNDVSRLTNLFRDAWVYLNPEDILSYRSDGTNVTLLLKPLAIAVEAGKDTEIYNLFGIEGSVGERIVGDQAAVEITTSASNIILPKDPAAVNKITQPTTPLPMTLAPTGANGTLAPTGANGTLAPTGANGTLAPAVVQGQPGVPTTNMEQIWRTYWNPQ